MQDTVSTFFITEYITCIQALSGILEVQVNCFTQIKTLQRGGGIKISTFNANFH